MTSPKRAQPDQVKRSDEETQDEIEQIMSEIEQLQKEIGSSEVAGNASHRVEPATMAQPSAKKAREERPKPHIVKQEPASDGPEIESSFTETDPLEEFRAGAGGGDSMEDNLADVKGEISSGDAFDDVEPEDVEPEDAEPEMDEDEIPETAPETREAIARASRDVEEAFEENVTEEEHFMHDHDDTGKGGDGALNMTLKGNMTLRLQYEIDGQTVTIGFADHVLRLTLADGTELKIPMRHRAPVRRAA